VIAPSLNVGFIEVAGPDARSFLQNLATNDFRPLTPGVGCETFFATHKARVVAHAVAHCLRPDVFVLGIEERSEALLKHLDHHLISERLELSPRTDWSMLRLLGADSQRWMEQATGQSLEDLKPWQGKTLDTATGSFVRRQGGLHPLGFDIVGPSATVTLLEDKARSTGLATLGRDDIEAIRIESGWPRWGHEMDENRFVVELGRTAAAISYAKGCYLGQEPIVMARDRGQVNRQLMGFRSPGETPLAVGAKIMMGEVELFKVTSSVYSSRWKQAIGLAYVYRGHQNPETTLTIATDAGERTATLASLPMAPP
jgi:folate-binding protein YgfZ